MEIINLTPAQHAEFKALQSQINDLNSRLASATEALHKAEARVNELEYNKGKEEGDDYEIKYNDLKDNVNEMLADAINQLDDCDPDDDLYKVIDGLMMHVCSRMEIVKEKLMQGDIKLSSDDKDFLVDAIDSYKDPRDA